MNLVNTVSSCQQTNTACAACCGLYNLKLDKLELDKLLKHRTSQFKKINFNFPAAEMVAYRSGREKKEANIPRHDPETYVCPFLGLIAENRPGCLAHPSITGSDISQNFSFYGASICQTYDCRTKDEDQELYWSDICSRIADTYYDYGRLVADYRFFSVFRFKTDLLQSLWHISNNLNDNPDQKAGSQDELYRDVKYDPLEVWQAFGKLAKARLMTSQSIQITSFEIGAQKGNSFLQAMQALLDNMLSNRMTELKEQFTKANIVKWTKILASAV